jgi:NADH-quinone oxidoreductase subunit L
MSALLITVPLLPLIAAIGALGIGRRLPWGGGELTVAATAYSLIASFFLVDGAHLSVIWFEGTGYRLSVGLEVTSLTRFIALVVAGTGFGVSIYSLGYMAREPDWARFFAEIGLFIGSMLTLVLADSLVLLFAAWEIVGAASYLLIGFHYAEAGAPQAAAKAFLMTRIGDVGLLLGWLLAFASIGNTEIASLVGTIQNGQFSAPLLTLIAFLMLAGAIGKSAQLPLTAWLPDAMIGPTPVSALLHSATMVAAGVFLIFRLYPLFEAAPVALDALFWIGATTALFAALVATAETDLKRVLAWSTSSQLGEMMIALGLGGPLAASFHLAAHAAFKSTLFLAAGSVQEQAGTRDLRRLSGLIRLLPLTGAVFLLAALALAAIPPFSGFWSEEAILAVSAQHSPAAGAFIVLLIFLAGLYIGRAAAATFFGARDMGDNIREPSWLMMVGMVLLAVAAAVLGWMLTYWLHAPEPRIEWRLLGITTAVLGLAAGAARRETPALGTWPRMLGTGLMQATVAPAGWIMILAKGIDILEHVLDAVVQSFAAGVLMLARSARASERFGFSCGGDSIAAGILRLAAGTEGAERFGFGGGGDRIAADIAVAGEGLRLLQTGRIYFYTLGLFLWAAAAVIAGAIVLWL